MLVLWSFNVAKFLPHHEEANQHPLVLLTMMSTTNPAGGVSVETSDNEVADPENSQLSWGDAMKLRRRQCASTATFRSGPQVHRVRVTFWSNFQLQARLVVTSMGKHAMIHPTVPTVEEKLPVGNTKSNTGYLLHIDALAVQVDQELMKQEIEHLQKHLIVAILLGVSSLLLSWLNGLILLKCR